MRYEVGPGAGAPLRRLLLFTAVSILPPPALFRILLFFLPPSWPALCSAPARTPETALCGGGLWGRSMNIRSR
eukprot:2266768-Prymnesium_polylepis.1